MKESDALYLLAYDESESPSSSASGSTEAAPAAGVEKMPVAMSHFRFEYNSFKKNNILYLYEIQATEKVRNHGLGTWMMKVLEMLSFKYEMSHLILTVFQGTRTAVPHGCVPNNVVSFYSANERACRFYLDKLKYAIDEGSPKAMDDEPHLILSKSFIKS